MISHTCFLGIYFFTFSSSGIDICQIFSKIVGKHEAVLCVVMGMVFANGWRKNMLLFGIFVKCILAKCTKINGRAHGNAEAVFAFILGKHIEMHESFAQVDNDLVTCNHEFNARIIQN